VIEKTFRLVYNSPPLGKYGAAGRGCKILSAFEPKRGDIKTFIWERIDE
jgi:hypothetical protein